MGFYSNWDEQAQAANKFLRTGSVGYTDYTNFSNIKSNRAGCVDSNDCASGWSCKSGYCTEPANNPGSTDDNSLNDQGCGGNIGGGAGGGGGGSCGASTSSGTSSCTKTGCGGQLDNPPPADDCCGESRCCRFDRFGVRCQCGDCPEDEECDQFCAAYGAAYGESAPACLSSTECDECSSCELFSFEGAKNTYKCQPKENGPCWCPGGQSCGDCETCSDGGGCVSAGSDCFPVIPPKEEPPLKEDTCQTVTFRQTVCSEGTPSCGSGAELDSWTDPDGFACLLCEYTEYSGDCTEPTDCNCHDDCGPCSLCSSGGSCVPDPDC